MEQSITLSTGIRLGYVERGAPDGVPVIFLHGVTDSWRSFEPVLPLLAPGIRAFAISQRGHGGSSRPAEGYRLTDMAGDLRGFMDAMAIPTATLVGHSMGSSVAQRFAIDCPERTSALVLAGAFASFQDPDLETFVRSSILPLRDPISPSFVREWQSSTIAQEVDPSHFEVVVAETLEVPAFVWHAAFEGFLRTDDFTGELASVAAPTLILWGDRDTYTGRDAQVRLLESLPDARLVTYDGVGHALHWEAPARFARDVATFVAGSRLGA